MIKSSSLQQSAFAFILFSFMAFPTMAASDGFVKLQLQKNSQPDPQSQSPDVQTLVRQGQEYLRTRQFSEAIEVSRRAIQIQPNLAAAHTLLGSALLEVGRRDEALVETKRAIELDPNDARAYLGLGIVDGAMRRYTEAIKAYKQAVNLDPSYLAAYINLGVAYGTIVRFAESAEAFQQALKIDPDNVTALNGLGIAQFRLGQHDEGIESVRRAVRLNPRFVNGHLNLARWYNGLGRYEEAVDAFTEVTRIVPKWPQTYFERSVLYLYLGKSEAAASDARMLLELTDWHSDRAEYMVIISTIGYRQAGKPVDAKQILDLSAKRSNTAAWPYPVIAYLRGDLTADALLGLAVNNNDRLTEAHGYLGMDLLLKDQKEAALPHFNWVREHGNKNFVEYTLALIELSRLENGAPSKP